MDRIRKNPWLSALLSWMLATVLVGGIYTAWQASTGQPVRWDLLKDAALIGIPFALINAWRDRKRKE